MKDTLFPFQQRAVNDLRAKLAASLGEYHSTRSPQIISFTAPTGAGKTIIMSSLIEDVYFGTESYPDQTEAIFLWISDSPQLNEQSKAKIDLRADRISLQQTVTIDDASFDKEMLEDGHIYFLNTQKLGRGSNLTKHSDARQYTIWETLRNTVAEKSNHFYVIIDEAHRGVQGNAAGRQTTIMQEFILGNNDDGIKPMPIIIGMSATIERFNRLASNTTATLRKVDVPADDVRSSGLLKDIITVNYPEDGASANKMAILQAATDEWMDKVAHWDQYCREQHYAYVHPVFVIQVENSTNPNRYSDTDLNECLRIIERRQGKRFSDGEVVHTFGDTDSTIVINNTNVQYRDPSTISDDKNIKVVFFKMNLSTGWDCPRAECMMSFRRATDYTNIAQLLGRMVRTPMQMHIMVDESLNNVHLFLPEFNKDNVQRVISELQRGEGSDIPVNVEADAIGNSSYQSLTIFPTEVIEEIVSDTQETTDGQLQGELPANKEVSSDGKHTESSEQQTTGSVYHKEPPVVNTNESSAFDRTDNQQDSSQSDITNQTQSTTGEEGANNLVLTPEPVVVKKKIRRLVSDGIDRAEVMKAINESGLLNYDVRTAHVITNYLSSLFAFCRFLSQFGLNSAKHSQVKMEIVNRIHDYTEGLRASGKYEELAKKVMEFQLASQSFDVYGIRIIESGQGTLFSSTDTDLDRQMRLAETKLCGEGIGNLYGQVYYNPDDENEYKIDVILFVVNEDNIMKLKDYAKDEYHNLVDNYRRKVVTLDENGQKRFNSIVSDGDLVSEHNFRLPVNINVSLERDGDKYKKHLFVDDKCEATFKLNGWEKALLAEEMKRDDFVCWLRNQPRKPWALCIPYEQNGTMHGMYPDFIVIRNVEGEYVIDVLEPHDQSRTDNLPKAIGLAKYAAKNPGAGRIQLIHQEGGTLKRVDLSRSQTRDKVLHAATDYELNNIFRDYSL